ncbi:MAG: hydroxymethylpyrimidine pyrophosphatase-like HAD family hydrolase [Pseudohongiellaceae bacterium]|jgi:hydroxymethylpyrimidine pyrophosphatase-like HAD family hydrolase
MTVIAFSDLDDTLFLSKRKCHDLSGHKKAAILPDGEIGAYSTPQQQALISLFNSSCIIPVTGRRTDSLSRVLIKFKSYKIASHGSIVLDLKNELHPLWRILLEEEEPLWRDRMYRFKFELEQYCEIYNLKLRVRVISDKGFTCYVCVKGEMLQLQKLKAIISELNTDGFVVHLNDRNLALLPPYASKRRAVTFLKNILESEAKGHLTFVGLGDSLSDSAFMSICDFQMSPSNSQISGILN